MPMKDEEGVHNLQSILRLNKRLCLISFLIAAISAIFRYIKKYFDTNSYKSISCLQYKIIVVK